MGSYVSFPILCFVNFIVNWIFIDPTLRCPIDKVPILVNGDDLFMVVPKSYYYGNNGWVNQQPTKDSALRNGYLGTSWRRFVFEVGFTESLGKNYEHPSIFCMNSQYYIWDGIIDSTPKAVDYARISLLMGGGRVVKTEIAEGKFDMSVSDRITRFVDGAISGTSDWVKDRTQAFVAWTWFNSDSFNSYIRKSPLSFRLPVCLGGLGAINNYGELSELDRKWAGYLLRDNVQLPGVFDMNSVKWEMDGFDSRTEALAAREGYVYRSGTPFECLVGSDFEGADLSAAYFLEGLDFTEVLETERLSDLFKEKRDDWVKGGRKGPSPKPPSVIIADRQYKRYVRNLQTKFSHFLQVKHTVCPVSKQTYDFCWEFPHSFDYFVDEDIVDTVVCEPVYRPVIPVVPSM